MSESGFVHKQANKVVIDNDKLYIKFCFNHELLEEKQFRLGLIKRGSEVLTASAVHTVEINEETGIYESTISLTENKQVISEEGTWDLYLLVEDEETLSEKKYRIKSNKAALELNYFLYDDIGTMFYAYTTNKGNVSFKTVVKRIIANIEEAHLTSGSLVHISGYGFMPAQNIRTEPIEKRLIITNNVNEELYTVPLANKHRNDLQEMYGGSTHNYETIGFEGEIDLNQYLTNVEAIYYRFYLELTFEENGEKVKVLSPRLKFVTFNPKYKRQRTKLASIYGKKRVLLKSTAKKNFLSVKVADYNAKQEFKAKVKGNLVRIKRSSKAKKLFKLAFALLGMLPAQKKTVIFESFLGKQYSDSPRAIYEYLKQNHPEFKLYWSVDKRFIQNFEDRGLNIVPRFSVKWLFRMSRSQYWVSNSRLPLWIPKPKNTTYLQTWHGTPLKRLAADMEEVHMPGTNKEKYKRNFLKESSNWDYLVSPNAYSSEIFARAFEFDRKMIESGYPRNDALINDNREENILALKERFALPLDKKIVLYAPTWRDDQFYGKGKYKFDLELDLDQLREELGDDYIVVLRMHYLVAENFDLTPYVGFAYDFSNYEDIRELYLISDLLITDYSSVFFDYGNLKRPMIFYVYDIETYRDKLRGFYFDFEKKAPGPLAKTTDEVIHYIKLAEKEPLNEKFEEFYNTFCYLEDGDASKRVVEEVFLK
ncbi:CDP-glycerol glycerophosphotransferase family protein [Niallia sp. MER 6]|uniref:CDP-glycerol glycerophosphotransferase family protein n=1 Tax=Niallia sp. MER 6 TaxID=2939567 RepID=UPI00203E2AB6|nr:CDP-glycerol glycerophosphotransferase family protein [Niallia sp. MER 6]MCM3029703.1 CDP-glycerol glycerophosphotransferase family protein [Niallia sp. MER 6]